MATIEHAALPALAARREEPPGHLAEAPPIPQADVQELAVLFVHGIGDQKPQSTLKEFGDPLIESARHRLGTANVRADNEIRRGADGEPAHRHVTIRDGDRTARLVAAESCWATEVTPPSYGQLLWWLLSVVPFLVQRIADRGLRSSTERMEVHRRNARQASGMRETIGHGLMLAGRALRRLWQNVIALTVTIVVMGGLVVIGLLSLTADARARLLALNRLPRGMRCILVRYIGDSYRLLKCPTDAQKMVGRVLSDLRWLEQHNPGARVVIVAHSQGAELARRALLARPAGKPVDSLITFGSGIVKLDAVGRLRTRLDLAWAAFALRLASAAALLLAPTVVVWGWAPLAGSLPRWIAPVALVVSLALLTAARLVLKRAVGSYDEERLGVTTQQVGNWLDLYASHDLVPEGSLPVGGFGTSKEIFNRCSLMRDHITYQENVEGFHAEVALELARIANWPVATAWRNELETAARNRAERMQKSNRWWQRPADRSVAVRIA